MTRGKSASAPESYSASARNSKPSPMRVPNILTPFQKA